MFISQQRISSGPDIHPNYFGCSAESNKIIFFFLTSLDRGNHVGTVLERKQVQTIIIGLSSESMSSRNEEENNGKRTRQSRRFTLFSEARIHPPSASKDRPQKKPSGTILDIIEPDIICLEYNLSLKV